MSFEILDNSGISHTEHELTSNTSVDWKCQRDKTTKNYVFVSPFLFYDCCYLLAVDAFEKL